MQIQSFTHPLIESISGKYGKDLVIRRTPSGKCIIARLGKRDLKRHPVTEREKQNQKLFAEAHAIAQEMYSDPETRALYEQRWLHDNSPKRLYGYIFSLVYQTVKQEHV